MGVETRTSQVAPRNGTREGGGKAVSVLYEMSQIEAKIERLFHAIDNEASICELPEEEQMEQCWASHVLCLRGIASGCAINGTCR